MRNLFAEMALRGKDEKRSTRAFNQFYKLFKNYVYTVCKDFFTGRGIQDDEHLKSFFHNVFVTIHEKSDSLEIADSVPDAEVRFVICAIIGKFIRYEGLQYLRELSPDKSVDIAFIDAYQEDIKAEEFTMAESIPLMKLNQALDTLSEEQRLILLECFRYHDENSNTPSKVLNELEMYFGKNRAALRKIKSRALKHVKEIILRS
ncbi:hypothetical protein [Tunicatimonas pelagia]|uniref:hypothetical protein n=1 Tax=Tunicatimonas pelagia TaxID=931531 RepID=UPI00266536F9|nr:hypothetical protein [Tunicatimonas pelagia]WKN46438.1 hypothetical protein P0M28_30780 [Tunicatimonas pelagia]